MDFTDPNTAPDTATTNYTYTPRHQIATIQQGTTAVADYVYDLAGRRSQKTLGNTTSTTYTHDNADQVTTLTHKLGATTLANFGYSYDLGGRRTAKAITGTGAIVRSDEAWQRGDGQSAGLPARRAIAGARRAGGKARQSYTYDAIAQVTAATLNGTLDNETFAYDAMGNRNSWGRKVNNAALVTTAYTTNALNQYTAIGTGAGTTPTYDPNGNTLGIPQGRSFTWDSDNRLKTATITGTAFNGAARSAAFTYDARGRQTRRTIGTLNTYYVWDGWSLIAEYQIVSNALTRVARYTHGPQLDEILLQQRFAGATVTPAYLHHDALGSTYLATNATGGVLERYTYTSFGQVKAFNATSTTALANPTATRFLYTGREWIWELGLNDHRHRFYSPDHGRWLSRDPIGEN